MRMRYQLPLLFALVEPCVGKNAEVGDVCCQLQVINGQRSFWVLVGEDVGSYGSAEC